MHQTLACYQICTEYSETRNKEVQEEMKKEVLEKFRVTQADQEQVTGCKSETLQLSGIITLEVNSCMDNLCHQLDCIEVTLHPIKNQQQKTGV